MALIRCPECGKEVSDRAKSCPNCGFPIEEVHKNEQEYKTDSKDERVEELPPEERPEMFECVQCGKPLPKGIERCVYCNHIYQEEYKQKLKEESETGAFGRDELSCPICGSKYLKIENDIPTWKKILEVWTIGTLLPITKLNYKKDMVYKCRKCGSIWEENEIIIKGEPKELEISPVIPIVVGCISIVLSLFMGIVALPIIYYANLAVLVLSAFLLIGGIISLCSVNHHSAAVISCKIYQISGILTIIFMLLDYCTFIPLLVSIAFFILMNMYEIRLS